MFDNLPIYIYSTRKNKMENQPHGQIWNIIITCPVCLTVAIIIGILLHYNPRVKSPQHALKASPFNIHILRNITKVLLPCYSYNLKGIYIYTTYLFLL